MPAKISLTVQYIIIASDKVLFKFSRLPIPRLFNLDSLSKQSGVLEVSFSRQKKILLLFFDSEIFVLANFLSKIKKKDPSIIIIEKKREDYKQGLRQNNDFLSHFIFQSVSRGNKVIKNNLNNYADLTSLLPMAFLVLGLVEFSRRPNMPKWNELIWYGYSLFHQFNGEINNSPEMRFGMVR